MENKSNYLSPLVQIAELQMNNRLLGGSNEKPIVEDI